MYDIQQSEIYHASSPIRKKNDQAQESNFIKM